MKTFKDTLTDLLPMEMPEHELPDRANKPHYHVWLLARTDKIFYKLAWPFNTRQAARQWAMRREPDGDRRIVIQCFKRHCGPKIDG